MPSYLVRNDGYKYQEFGLHILDVIGVNPGKYKYSHIEMIHFSLNNISFKDRWNPIQSKFIPIGGKSNVPIPDICRWMGATLILSPKAYESLSELLAPYGELLPVQVGDDIFHIFNCMTYAKVDESRSERTYTGSVIDEIKKIVFDSDDVTNKIAFKTDFNQCIDIFCNEQLKNAVDKSKLTGVIFSENLAPEF